MTTPTAPDPTGRVNAMGANVQPAGRKKSNISGLKYLTADEAEKNSGLNSFSCGHKSQTGDLPRTTSNTARERYMAKPSQGTVGGTLYNKTKGFRL